MTDNIIAIGAIASPLVAIGVFAVAQALTARRERRQRIADRAAQLKASAHEGQRLLLLPHGVRLAFSPWPMDHAFRTLQFLAAVQVAKPQPALEWIERSTNQICVEFDRRTRSERIGRLMMMLNELTDDRGSALRRANAFAAAHPWPEGDPEKPTWYKLGRAARARIGASA